MSSKIFFSLNFSQSKLLLDVYTGASAAYSVRKLRSAYSGFCLRVQRSSDNTTLDIGFSGNNLDTSAITTFVGGGNGNVTKWYDQSGNGNDLITTGSTNYIVQSGSLNTQGTKPCIKLSTSSFTLTTPVTAIGDFSAAMVQKRRVTGVLGIGFGSTTIGPIMNQYLDNNFYFQFGSGILSPANVTGAYVFYTANTANYDLFDVHHEAVTDGYINENSISQTTTGGFFTAASTNITTLGSWNTTNADGVVQEAILWNSSKRSVKLGIQTNINSYYAIY